MLIMYIYIYIMYTHVLSLAILIAIICYTPTYYKAHLILYYKQHLMYSTLLIGTAYTVTRRLPNPLHARVCAHVIQSIVVRS